jgi:hypothetical protein
LASAKTPYYYQLLAKPAQWKMNISVPGGKSTKKSNSPQSASKSFDSTPLKPLASPDYSLTWCSEKPIDF